MNTSTGIVECSLCGTVCRIEWLSGCDLGCDHCPSCGAYAGIREVPTCNEDTEYETHVRR